MGQVRNLTKRPVGSLPPSKPPAGPVWDGFQIRPTAPPRRSVCAPAAMSYRWYCRPYREGDFHVVQQLLQGPDFDLISAATDSSAGGATLPGAAGRPPPAQFQPRR